MAIKRKPRGLKRKCRIMIARLLKVTRRFPEPHRNSGFWHLHLPLAENFIDSNATPRSVRRLCVQTLLERAFHLATLAPQNEFSRVVVVVSVHDLHASQIIVFFSEDYFDSFFVREDEKQKWLPLKPKRSLRKEWSLSLPAGFQEKGFRQEIVDDLYENRSKCPAACGGDG